MPSRAWARQVLPRASSWHTLGQSSQFGPDPCDVRVRAGGCRPTGPEERAHVGNALRDKTVVVVGGGSGITRAAMTNTFLTGVTLKVVGGEPLI